MSTPGTEEEESGVKGRPNAYWAAVKEAEGTGFSASFRGVPQPHAGPQSVKPEDTLGSIEDCWCGQPAGHDWPGKASGRKHPKEQGMSNSRTEDRRVARNTFKGFAKDGVDLMVQAINDYHCEWKASRNSVTVYGLNGTPYVFGRAFAGPDVRKALSWFEKHVVAIAAERLAAMLEEQERSIEPADIAALAEALNGPEHEVPTAEEVAEKVRPEPEPEPETEPEAEIKESSEEWIPYVRTDGIESEFFETNGTVIRCTQCDFVTENKRALSGHHLNTHQKDKMRKALWSNPEAQAKRSDALRYNNLHTKVTEALDLLADLVDYETDSAKVAALEEENAELRKQLESQTLLREMYENERQRADDLQARFDLMREAMGA